MKGRRDTDEELWSLERSFRAGDAAVHDRQLAADALMVFAPPVGLLDRAASIAAVGQSPRWTSVEFDIRRRPSPAPSVACPACAVQAVRETGSVYRALCSSTSVGRDGHWPLVLHQQTPAD